MTELCRNIRQPVTTTKDRMAKAKIAQAVNLRETEDTSAATQ